MFFSTSAFLKKLIQCLDGFNRRAFFSLPLNLKRLDGAVQICAGLRQRFGQRGIGEMVWVANFGAAGRVTLRSLKESPPCLIFGDLV
jgi:hypothetical protein